MNINRLRELAGIKNEAFRPRYYTNADDKMVRQIVMAHLGNLRMDQRYAKPIADYILHQELDMNQEQLEEYIEEILAGEYWYPGQRSPFQI